MSDSLPEHMALADLKKAIKAFKVEQTPKLSSKKSVLSEYAMRVGILKSRLGQKPVEAMAAPLEVRSEKKSEVKESLPEVLKAKPKKGTPPPPLPLSRESLKQSLRLLRKREVPSQPLWQPIRVRGLVCLS